MDENLKPINCECHGCMDGRPVLFKAKKIEGKWQMVVSREQAAEVVEAKLPGGALGFIAVLQKVAGLELPRAIEVAEMALKEMGMEPQLHLDNDHGHFDVEGKSDEELIKFVSEQTGGCGFAGLVWGEEAPALINQLKDNGWLIEVLNGHHEEKDALNIDRSGVAIDTAKATQAEHQSFTFNRQETRKALEALAKQLKPGEAQAEFVDKSMDWFNEQFPMIAQKLRGIEAVQTVA